MQCRSDCGACCIAPSISSPIPGMPNGKPAGQACIQLLDDLRCAIFNDPSRPAVCKNFSAEKHICGDNRQQAINILSIMENDTAPDTSSSIRKN